MPVTFKDLRDNNTIRDDFLNLTESQRELAFSQMEAPEGFTPEQTDLLKIKILSLPTKRGTNKIPDAPLAWKQVPAEALKNILPSTIEMGKNIWQTVAHPIKTVDTLEGVVVGAIEKLIPGEQKGEQSFNMAVNFFKERYGSVNGLKKTMAKDPAGFLADLAGLASVVGGGARIAQLPKITKAASIVSKADPASLLTKGIGKAVEGAPSQLSFIKTALKVPRKTPSKRIHQLAEEFLKKGHLNTKTVIRYGNEIKELQKSIANRVDSLTKAGKKIETSKFVNAIDDLKKSYEGFTLSPDKARNIKQLDRIKKKLMESGNEFLTPTEVQRSKVLFNKDYVPDVGSRSGAVTKAARDAIRKTAKTELERIDVEVFGALDKKHPGLLKIMNENEGIKIELKKIVEARVKAIHDSPTIKGKGLVTGGIAAAGAGLISGIGVLPGLAFAALTIVVGKVLADPRLNVTIARLLNRIDQARKLTGKTVKALSPASQAAFQTGRIERELKTRNPRLSIQNQRR